MSTLQSGSTQRNETSDTSTSNRLFPGEASESLGSDKNKSIHIHYHYVIHCSEDVLGESHQGVTYLSPIGISPHPLVDLKEGAVVAISSSIFPSSCLDNAKPQVGATLENAQWLVKKTDKGHFLFASLKNQEKNNHLRIGKKGNVSCDGGTGVWAQFKVESLGGSQISIQSVGNEEAGQKFYLAVDETSGELIGNSPAPYPFFLIPLGEPETPSQDEEPKEGEKHKQESKEKVFRLGLEKERRKMKEREKTKDARELLRPDNTIVLCSFERKQNRKRSDGWHLGVSPTGLLVPDAGQSSWGQWRVEVPEKTTAKAEKKSETARLVNAGESETTKADTGKQGETEPTTSTATIICLSSRHTPEWHLRVNSDGMVSPKGHTGNHAQFKPIFHSNGRVSFQCMAFADKPNRDGGTGWCLGVKEDGNIVGNADSSCSYAQFLVREARKVSKDFKKKQQPNIHIPLKFVGRSCKYGPKVYRTCFKSPEQAEEPASSELSKLEDTQHPSEEKGLETRLRKEKGTRKKEEMRIREKPKTEQEQSPQDDETLAKVRAVLSSDEATKKTFVNLLDSLVPPTTSQQRTTTVM